MSKPQDPRALAAQIFDPNQEADASARQTARALIELAPKIIEMRGYLGRFQGAHCARPMAEAVNQIGHLMLALVDEDYNKAKNHALDLACNAEDDLQYASIGIHNEIDERPWAFFPEDL